MADVLFDVFSVLGDRSAVVAVRAVVEREYTGTRTAGLEFRDETDWLVRLLRTLVVDTRWVFAVLPFLVRTATLPSRVTAPAPLKNIRHDTVKIRIFLIFFEMLANL